MSRKPLFLHIPFSEKILFVKHLSIMVKSGTTLVASLELLRKQVRSRAFKYVLDKVVPDVQNGQFLSDSLAKFRWLFGDLFINVVKIGEESGSLSENLTHLADELKKKQQLRQKIRSAFIYPIIVLCATLGVVGMLIFFVLPKIIPIFTSLRITLPWTTRFVIFISQFLIHNGVFVFLGGIVLIVVWTFLLRIQAMRFFTHRLILILPVVGPISKMANTADFTRTLALLLKSGIKIVESLIITSESVPNLVFRRAIREVAETVRRGESMHVYLNQHEHVFYPTVSRMIEVGDATGTLEPNLFYLADFYENEVDELTKNLSVVIEPLLLLFMGGIVGFVAISIITPIYEITQSISR